MNAIDGRAGNPKPPYSTNTRLHDPSARLVVKTGPWPTFAACIKNSDVAELCIQNYDAYKNKYIDYVVYRL